MAGRELRLDRNDREEILGRVVRLVEEKFFDPNRDLKPWRELVEQRREQLLQRDPPTPGAVQPSLTPATYYGGFAGKVTNSGRNIAWMTWFGGSPGVGGADIGFQSHVVALAVDPQGRILLTGFSQPSQLPPFPATPMLGPSYVARLSGDGTSLQELFVGPLNSAGAGLALTPAGSFVSVGPSGSLWVETSASGASLLAMANAAGGPVSGVVVPAEIISLYGPRIGLVVPVQNTPSSAGYSSSLNGYQILFDGVPAPLLYLGPTQINTVVPQAVAYRDYTHVQLATPSGSVDGPTLAVRQAQPYAFQYNLTAPLGDGTTTLAAALNQDGSINSPQNPAKGGQVVTIFVSGGGSNPYFPRADGTVVSDTRFRNAVLPVSVLYDPPGASPETSLEVLYAGDAPEMVLGVMQVNFRLPEVLPPSSWATYQFVLQVGGTLGGQTRVAVTAQ